ncbi:unnamed protein product [Blepharisma stoltei]|uniref:C2H2-type domain-containing protein n=1 Tax=Blepharisma stoltei TaxID=1481888 RepID=A0AAU9JJ52_9CILI|nr:unnamed protein product [Blepharisma stoltei]
MKNQPQRLAFDPALQCPYCYRKFLQQKEIAIHVTSMHPSEKNAKNLLKYTIDNWYKCDEYETCEYIFQVITNQVKPAKKKPNQYQALINAESNNNSRSDVLILLDEAIDANKMKLKNKGDNVEEI